MNAWRNHPSYTEYPHLNQYPWVHEWDSAAEPHLGGRRYEHIEWNDERNCEMYLFESSRVARLVTLLTHDISTKGAHLHIEIELELDLFHNVNSKVNFGSVRTWISLHVCPQENQFWWEKWNYISASAIAIATEPQSQIQYLNKAFIIEMHT